MTKPRSMYDGGEHISLFEPLMISEGSRHLAGLNDLVLELAEKSAILERSVPQIIASALVDFVRSMNCYYSNLIEDHYTHPIEIEQALKRDYSHNPKKRNLQLEAVAHIEVQKWIDEGGLTTPPTDPVAICEIHRRFCEHLPEDLLVISDPKTGKQIRIIPGTLRRHDVQIGRHVPISPGALPRFLARFHEAYQRRNRTQMILAVPCAHHRLLWIHPFLDGNGRVARLMSYAMLHNVLKAQGLWSVARGLARKSEDYKYHLSACDARRRNDLDGRGVRSEESLVGFVEFFLKSCIDQIEFMTSLMQPDQLQDRIVTWAAKEIQTGKLPSGSDRMLSALLYHKGRVERGAVHRILGTSERTARRITSSLLKAGLVRSKSIRAPLELALPARYVTHWMPGLIPEYRPDGDASA